MNKKIRVFLVNVGFGNAVFIHTGKSLVVFDSGHYEKSRIQYTNEIKSRINIKELCDYINPKNINRIIFVLSHPHRDHYNLKKTIENCLNNVSNHYSIAFDNGMYPQNDETYVLESLNKLQSIKDINKKTIKDLITIDAADISELDYELKNIRVFANDNSFSSEYKEQQNDKGLMLYVKTGNKRIILPGDMSYVHWFNGVSDKHSKILIENADCIVIPHHIMKTTIPSNISEFKVKKEVKWYACIANKQTSDDKFNEKHVEFLNAINAQITYTDEPGKKYLEIK